MINIVKAKGSELRNIRLKKCLNVEQAGTLCGISRSTIWNIEKGGTVKLLTAYKIAKGYDINTSDFFTIL